jgi:hypothetical protein
MERPPLPPGYAPMKTLVLNINGTLVHSEYKVGKDFSATYFSLESALKSSKDQDLQHSLIDWEENMRLFFSATKKPVLFTRLQMH